MNAGRPPYQKNPMQRPPSGNGIWSVPMSRTVYELLRGQNIRDISGRVFPVSARCLRQGFEKAVDRAGLQDFTFHDLRHTFATRLVQNGAELYKVKELLGHKSISMTMRYSHHCPDSLRSSIEFWIRDTILLH